MPKQLNRVIYRDLTERAAGARALWSRSLFVHGFIYLFFFVIWITVGRGTNYYYAWGAVELLFVAGAVLLGGHGLAAAFATARAGIRRAYHLDRAFDRTEREYRLSIAPWHARALRALVSQDLRRRAQAVYAMALGALLTAIIMSAWFVFERDGSRGSFLLVFGIAVFALVATIIHVVRERVAQAQVNALLEDDLFGLRAGDADTDTLGKRKREPPDKAKWGDDAAPDARPAAVAMLLDDDGELIEADTLHDAYDYRHDDDENTRRQR